MGSCELALNNGKLFFNNSFIDAHVAVSGSKIVDIKKAEIKDAEQVIDCTGKIILPGLIDSHVHFRVPGTERKEDWKSGSRAALHGGISTVLDMPNNNPAIITQKELKNKRKIVEKDSLVNFGFYFGASSQQEEMQKANGFAAFKIYMGSSTGNLLVADSSMQQKVFAMAYAKKKPLAVHAEDEETIKQNALKFAKQDSPALHSQVRSIDAEVIAVRNALKFQQKANTQLHICHVSAARSLEEIEKVKKFSNITCETTPTYLFFSQKDVIEKGNLLKVNPSIKTENDRKVLWEAITSGLIDTIASDHAPHLLEEKQQGYWNTPSGIPGIETMVPLMLDAHSKGLIAMEKIPMLFSENPSKIFHLKGKGFIKKGFDADFTIVDLKKEWKVKQEEFFAKCKWSPFDGLKLKGFIESTIVNGKVLFEDGNIVSRELGKEVEYV